MQRQLILVLVVMLAAGSAAALTPATMLVMPAASRGPGAGTSVWQMDMYLGNAGSQAAHVSLTWLERNTDNTGAPSVSVTVPAGRTMALADVIHDRFGLDSGSGAILITSDVPITATSRIYNLQNGVTFGQGFDGLATPDNTPEGSGRWITGLRQDGGSRSNLFAVAGPTGAELSFAAHGSDGGTLGTRSYSVPPWGALYAPLTDVAGGSPGDVSVLASVSSGSAWFAGSRIDQASGDPFTAAAATPDPTLVNPSDLNGIYVGNWYNETFGSTGSAQMTFSVDPATSSFTATVDLGGNVFGGADPPPQSFSGTIQPGGGTLELSSQVFGNVTATIDARGRMSSSATDIPAAGIDRLEANGVLTGQELIMGYTITFSGGGGTATGMVHAVRQ